MSKGTNPLDIIWNHDAIWDVNSEFRFRSWFQEMHKEIATYLTPPKVEVMIPDASLVMRLRNAGL